MLRLLVPLAVCLAWAPAASAWSWPVQGLVLEPFSYDQAHPYAAGQHRGIDIGADAEGETVLAPAAGTVSFAGTVPTSGRSVTIETADGYSVTLTHLGSIRVAEGATVAEQDAVGTIGSSGTPEVDVPYVHLGIRHAADPNGYVDPLDLLPAATGSGATQSDSGSSAAQPSSSATPPVASAAPPSTSPASPPAPVTRPATPEPAVTGGSTIARVRPRLPTRTHEDAGLRHPDAQPAPSTLRRAVHGGEEAVPRTPRHVRVSRPRASEPTSSRQPVVGTAPTGPTGLQVGQDLPRSAPVSRLSPSRPATPSFPLPLFLNGAAALIALAAALAAARSRGRRRAGTSPSAAVRVLRVPQPTVEPRRMSRAA